MERGVGTTFSKDLREGRKRRDPVLLPGNVPLSNGKTN